MLKNSIKILFNTIIKGLLIQYCFLHKNSIYGILLKVLSLKEVNWRNKLKLKKILCAIALSLMVFLTACSNKNAEYESYHVEVNKLYEKIVSTDAIINNIDVNSEDSVEEMFSSLDKLKVAFDDFANIEPPEDFADCKFLAESASKYITTAEENFHAALDDEYDDVSFQNGISNYNEVIKCVNYMGDVLQKK